MNNNEEPLIIWANPNNHDGQCDCDCACEQRLEMLDYLKELIEQMEVDESEE